MRLPWPCGGICFRCVHARRGFTLAELLVVIGILGMLVGLLLPAVQQIRESSSRASCSNNLRQLGIALTSFHDSRGRLPPLPAAGASDPNRLLSWRALILPQIEQDGLWRLSEAACRTQPDPWQNPPHAAIGAVLKPLVCPSDGRLFSTHMGPTAASPSVFVAAAFCSYIGVGGGHSQWDGLLGMPGPGIQFAAVTDGLSNTLMAGERPPPDTYEAGQWYATGRQGDVGLPLTSVSVPGEICQGPFEYGPGRTDNRCDVYHFWSLHPGGGNFLFGDCSVRRISYSGANFLDALGTRAGGEAIAFHE